MKRTYKKIVSFIISILMLFVCCVGQGCKIEEIFTEDSSPIYGEEVGDFLVTESERFPNIYKYNVYNFSKQVENKSYVIVPRKIKGNSIRVYEKQNKRGFYKIRPFDYYSNLKRVYFEKDIWIHEWDEALINYKKPATIYYDKGSFKINRGIIVYSSPHVHTLGTDGFVNIFSLKKSDRDILFALSYSETNKYNTLDTLLANIHFMYNYQDAPDNGCYWIDDLDTGETLVYIPTPSRDGYTFGGWYADSECTMPYDFTIPHIKKPLKEGSYEWLEEKNGQKNIFYIILKIT